MVRRGGTVALAVMLGLPGGIVFAAAAPPCSGRYLVRDAPARLIDGGAQVGVDAVVLTPSAIAIDSGCSFAPATMTPKRTGGWTVRARWSRCGSMPRVRLRGTLGPDCERLNGYVTAKRGRARKPFVATPSVCGDGIVDPGAGESCEPPGEGACDAACRSVPPPTPTGPVTTTTAPLPTTTTGPITTTTAPLPTTTTGPVTTTTTLPTCEGQETFEEIQNRIFTPTCALTGCHGSFFQMNLDLRDGASRVSLVDVLAENPTARAAGKKRVAPGDAAGSFLSQKVHGALLADEGERMPLLGLPLSDLELALIDAWIAAGAPATGTAPGAPCLPREEYRPVDPLQTPPGGYQFVLDGPWLQPGEEQEGCLWVPVPSATDFPVSMFEIALNPGTHHFAVFEYIAAGAPQTGVWQRNNFGCFNGASFGGSIGGAPYAPYVVNTYPPGVARLLKAGHYIGLNAHYHNEFDVPIQIKVWTNVYPYDGTPQHIAQTLQDLGTTFTISVAPFTQAVHKGRFTNTTGGPLTFLGLSGHMHFRGLRFTAWKSDGTKIYESFDWSHPGGRGFDPPFVFAPGDFFDYECFYDNGVTRPVRRDAFGNPTTLRFGVSTEDAMCILTGTYYQD